jgi:hypothetical protein
LQGASHAANSGKGVFYIVLNSLQAYKLRRGGYMEGEEDKSRREGEEMRGWHRRLMMGRKAKLWLNYRVYILQKIL